MKLIDYLLARNLAPDERTARGLILRGDVLVSDRPVASPNAEVEPDAPVRVRGDLRGAVSRGRDKLAPVLRQAHFDCAGRLALDLGAGPGGFTQALLDAGARRVYCVDVGYGVLAHQLRTDPRVVALERVNARELTRAQVPEEIDRAVGDLSFISWSAVLPAIVPLLSPAAELLLLVKPQFELAAAGQRDLIPKGVVQEPAALKLALIQLYNVWEAHALNPARVIPAGLRGARGNREYFVYLKRGEAVVTLDMYIASVEQAIAEDPR